MNIPPIVALFFCVESLKLEKQLSQFSRCSQTLLYFLSYEEIAYW